MVHAKRIAILIGLILFAGNAVAQSFELVRPADFRYFVTVDEDTVSTRSLDYKAFQDAVHQKCEYPESIVTVHPIGVEVRGCPEPIVYIPYAVYEDLIRNVDWEHRQSVPDIHVINLEVDHQADSLITWIEACGQMWKSGEEIACNEMAYVYAEGIKGDRTVIVRDSVDLEMFNDFFLTSNQSDMAFSGLYASTPVPAPDSDLADFSFLIDLSTLPQAWWDEVDTADPTKGRSAKDDGTTELAADWIEFDDTAETGWVRVKWSGTNPSAGGQTARIYPPKSGNDSYLATDTFGQYNAYDSNWAGYWADGGETDRTSNQNNGTATGTPTDVAGKIGSAKDYSGGTNYYTAGGTSDLDLTGDITIISWVNGNDSTANAFYTVGVAKRDGGSFQYHFRQKDSPDDLSFLVSGGSITSTLSYPMNDTTAFMAVSWESGVEALFQLDGTTETVASTNTTSSQSVTPTIANQADETHNWSGWQDDVQIHSVARGEDWLAYEYAQSNDNATFWGTWTVEGGGGSTFEASFSINSAMNASSSSVSTAEAGISLDTGADVSDGSTATGESLLTIAHNQNASAQSDANAEASLSLSNLLQIAFSKQSVTDASFSLPVVHQVTTVSDTQIVNEASFSLALQKAITTEQISTIEVSYSLNSAQQTAMESVSTAEAAMSITLSAAINFISTALAEADISFNAVQSLTFSGQTVGVEVTLADGRTLTISLENRTYLIPQETRTFTILSENRTLTIEP